MASPDTPTFTRFAPPDVFTVLLVVATLLMAMGVAWMLLVNIEHSEFGNTSGGPMTLVDLK